MVIGRIMNERVKPFARMFGFSWYAPRPPVPTPPPDPLKLPTKEQNRRWIRKQMKLERLIFDVGPGPAVKPSKFYEMELKEVRNYRKGRLMGRNGNLYPRYRLTPFPGVLCDDFKAVDNAVLGRMPNGLCRP